MTATLAYGSVPINNKVFLPLIKNGNLPPPGIDPIRNGSFEAGRDGNWIENSPSALDLVTNDLPVATHGGSWSVWLGGVLENTDTLTQIGIPEGSQRYLHYWYWIASADICGYDFAKVYINESLLTTLDLCTSSNTGGWVHGLLDLNSFLGTTISLEFEVTTDVSENSNFFLDDVSMSASPAFAPYEGVSLSNVREVEPKK
jgi:hypothetical protein